MAPKQHNETTAYPDDVAAKVNGQDEPGKVKYVRKIVWRNVIIFAYVHLAGVYGIYLMLTSARIYTSLWAWSLYYVSGLGITAGAHRLWSHRSYKARWPLRFMLTVFNTMAFQNDIYEWSRDHRLHHKYSETNADPHNSNRGFFFCHIGWLLVRKHPDVMEKGKNIDLSDLEADSIIMFQRRYYKFLMPLFAFVLPTIVPVYFWNETWTNSWIIAGMFRFCFLLNMTWLVNSAAHMFGNKPYDKTINPSENIWVSLGALGEGWHNYHHVFPWDYKTSELGRYYGNQTAGFIDLMAKLGLAYDLKTVSRDTILKRSDRTGDGSRVEHLKYYWGWNDEDIPKEDKNATIILNK